jgi:hypothetical protein
MDQPADQVSGPAVDERFLPALEHDRPLVLLARTVLGKQARPALPVRGHVATALPRHAGDALPVGQHMLHRIQARCDDVRIGEVERDPQPVHAARMPRYAAVAEVEAKKVDVLLW